MNPLFAWPTNTCPASASTRGSNRIPFRARAIGARAAFATAVLFAVSGAIALAQLTPNASPGFRPEGAYEIGDIDEVSLFNGALTIGFEMPPSRLVGGPSGLSRALRLTYSSSAWDAVPYECLGGGIGCGANIYPKPATNAGLGWRVSFGTLYKPPAQPSVGHNPDWVYITPEGTEHTLYPTLHPTDNEDAGDSPWSDGNLQETMYSRDSSYYRVKCTPTTFATCTVEHPNGEEHVLLKYATNDYRVTEIRDRFLNKVLISYNPGNTLWTITDTSSSGSNNETKIQFLSPGGSQPRIIDYIDIPCVGGTCPVIAGCNQPTTTHARWNFTYADKTGVWPPQTYGTNAQRTVKVLTEVKRPDCSTFSVPVSGYDQDMGSLKRLTLPTGGRIEWDWAGFEFPQIQVRPPGICPDELDPNFNEWTTTRGVGARRTYDWDGTLLGQWTYERVASPIDPLHAMPEKLTVKVRTPLGDRTEHYFSIYPVETNYWETCAGITPYLFGPQWETHLEDYGLPYTMETSDPNATGGVRFLSSRTYDCTSGTPNCTTLTRTTYVGYDGDEQTIGVWKAGRLLDRNRRQLTQRVVYNLDSSSWNRTTNSDFDGLGHYRVAEQVGGNGLSGSKTRRVHYNDGITYPNPTPFSRDSAWILGTFDWTKVEGGSGTAYKEYRFDTSTGFLNCARTRLNLNDPRNVHDLLVRFTPDAKGNVSQERYYGGDLKSVGTSGNCSDGVNVEYTIDHTYSTGVRSTSRYAGEPWYFLDQTIDSRTGLVTSSSDTADVATNYQYDALGRITRIDPQQPDGDLLRDSVTSISYPIALPLYAKVHRCSPGTVTCDGTNAKQTEEFQYDGLGRIAVAWKTRPEGTGTAWSKQVTTYDGVGNRASVSSWVDEDIEDPGKTEFSDYDPFGRAGTITSPDDELTTIEYTGVRRIVTTQDIDLSAADDTETSVSRREIYDALGRLVTVDEHSTGPGAYTSTNYTYDAVDRLVRAETVAATGNQARVFNYDRRGFLTSEVHPEKGGINGNGTVTHGSYDSRGHAGSRTDVGGGAIPSRTINFEYDSSERLRKVKSNGTVWKELTYYSGNTAGRSLGKLATAFRRNDIDRPYDRIVDVTETYRYEGRQGRASERTTEVKVGGVISESWNFAADYSIFGALDWIDYPVCTGASCGNGAETPPRQIQMTQKEGMWTKVTDVTTTPSIDWVPNITYHPNLTIASVTHGNGLVETIAADPDGMARPESFTWTFGPASATTGTYLYDGAGNIQRMGTDHFQYDSVSRLVLANLASLGKTQATNFDTFGNLIEVTTTPGGTENFLVDDLNDTNRLQVGSYDAAGNLTIWNGNLYTYDPLDAMTSWTNGTEGWSYVYTADDERLLALRWDTSAVATWTVRDFANRVLRRDARVASGEEEPFGSLLGTCPGGTPGTRVFCDGFETGNAVAWSASISGLSRVVTDYIYRGGQLVGRETVDGEPWFHFGLDHLGTVRVVTNDIPDDVFVARHTYFPFGREATPTDQDDEPMKFAGYERDMQSSPSAAADDLDYLHARFFSPITGRLLSTDPVIQLGRSMRKPQLWNRYSYALGNPLKHTDPAGLLPRSAIQEIASRYFGEDDCPDSFFGCARQIIENALNSAVPPPSADTSSYSSEDLAEIGATPEMTTNMDVAAGTQEGLIDFTSNAGAAVVTVAAVVGGNAGGGAAIKAGGKLLAIGGHATLRMTERGVSFEQLQAVANVAKPFDYFHAGAWKTGYYDPGSRVFFGAIGGEITTVMTKVKPKYIENLRAVIP